MKALTVRQPWAGLLVAGIKDVENRRWRTNHRGPLLIHAGLSTDPYTGRSPLPPSCELHGVILGLVTIVDCIRGSRSRWAEPDQWHWIVANARGFRRPIPAKGQLTLWIPDRKVMDALPLYARR